MVRKSILKKAAAVMLSAVMIIPFAAEIPSAAESEVIISEVDISLTPEFLDTFRVGERPDISVDAFRINDESAGYFLESDSTFVVRKKGDREVFLNDDEVLSQDEEYVVFMFLKTDKDSVYRFAPQESMKNSVMENYSFEDPEIYDENAVDTNTMMVIKYNLGSPAEKPSGNPDLAAGEGIASIETSL